MEITKSQFKIIEHLLPTQRGNVRIPGIIDEFLKDFTHKLESFLNEEVENYNSNAKKIVQGYVDKVN